MKISALCTALLLAITLASGAIFIVENPVYAEETAPQVAESPAPATDFGAPADSPEARRADIERAIATLQLQRDALLQPIPGESYDESLLRQEQAALKQNRIDKLSSELMFIQ